MEIVHFSEINRAVSEGAEEYIKLCDDRYEEKCREVAQGVAEHIAERPIILLAGPSGSGKTTTALKIESYLEEMGLQAHTVSMDNYFLPKEQIVVPEGEKIDYESPYRIDIPLLQEHMLRLADGGDVEMPMFDFPNQARIKGKTLRREKGELILFEGIHALNPEVTGYEDIASCVYVSVRTRIQVSSGELVHPELIRLMRRIIRDRNFRSRAPSETMYMFDSVQQGENLYINPYKPRAHYNLDTFLGYEACVYKDYLAEDFERLKTSYNGYERFRHIEELIRDIAAVGEEILPLNSMVREFIGGSVYDY